MNPLASLPDFLQESPLLVPTYKSTLSFSFIWESSDSFDFLNPSNLGFKKLILSYIEHLLFKPIIKSHNGNWLLAK